MSRFVSLGRLLPVALLSSFALSLTFLGPSLAETDKGKKYALLVGVRKYDSFKFTKLQYTENDVEELEKVLSGTGGFASVRVLSTTRGEARKADAPTADNIRAEIKKLLSRKKRDDTLLVALSGHGILGKIKDKDENFFCPADAQINDNDTLIALGKLFSDLDDSGAGVKLLLVDACRNDPKAGRNVDLDTLPRPPRGTAALFSCKSGERAFETDKLPGGRGHGVFFYHVLQGLKGEAKNRRGEVTWDALTIYVKEQVSDEVPVLIGGGARQTPQEIKNLEGKPPVLIARARAEGGKEPPAKAVVVKEAAREITNSIGMKLVRIPAGKFTMGSTDYADEGPTHEVKITKAFYLGVYAVTQAEYEKVMGSNPSYFSADGGGKEKVAGMNTSKLPVEKVSWADAVKFCDKLSEMAKEKAAKRTYRLPTEAEWEYACRAGTTTKYHSGEVEDDLKEVGWYLDNSGGRTHNVGKKKANKFGLYDMHGNVYQWCADWYGKDYYKESDKEDPRGPKSGTSHVLRGGSWFTFAWGCRAAVRYGAAPGFRNELVGFRVVCVAAGTR